MNGKRLALGALVCALIIAAFGGPSSTTGQSSQVDAPGLTYGGKKDQYAAWLRLAPGRRLIAALRMEWAIAPSRCSNGKTYSSVTYAGYEELISINVGEAGDFKKTVILNYSNESGRGEERAAIEGTIDGNRASGTIRGRVRVAKPNGKVVRCTFGPQSWRLFD